jgi:hypothetical protein
VADDEDLTTPGTPAGSPLDRAVRELERHVARGGWDGPMRVFALIRTAQAMADDPALRAQLPPDLVATADEDPTSITSVEQEGLPEGETIEDVLGRISWPPAVHGAAVVVERFVVPPEAERDLPDDPEAALAALMAHPARQDVRLAVGVLRDGTSSCAVRTRAADDDASVGTGADVAPGLVAALRDTLA